MKILKPGKVEMRKFVCPSCGCIFVAMPSEHGYACSEAVFCPQDGCNNAMPWDDGEPYEEPYEEPAPTPTESDRERLDRLLIPCPESNSLRGYCVEHLINSGVTFEED